MRSYRLGQPKRHCPGKSLAHSRQHCPNGAHGMRCRGRIPGSLLQFRRFVSDAKLAKRYFVSGMVQGVGFRYFTQDAAEKLRISGFVRNLRDGRVEVFAIGAPQQHAEFRAMLERGPRFASISEVQEETAAPDPQYEGGFIINPSV